MNKLTTLFVGLNNRIGNSSSVLGQTLLNLLEQNFDGFTITNSVGCWKGSSEPVARVELIIDYSSQNQIDKLMRLVRSINAALSQECVLVSVGALVVFVGQNRDSQGYNEDWQNFIAWVRYGRDAILEPSKPAQRSSGHIGVGGLQADSVGDIYPYQIIGIGPDVWACMAPNGAIIKRCQHQPNKESSHEAYRSMVSVAKLHLNGFGQHD